MFIKSFHFYLLYYYLDNDLSRMFVCVCVRVLNVYNISHSVQFVILSL